MPHVLIVEDEPSIVMVLREVLNDEGYITTDFSDGLDALQWLQQQTIPPDIVLVDLFMPGVSGKSIVEAMRHDLGLPCVPVVLVTGAVPSVQDFPAEGSYQGIICKPFDVVDVLHKISSLLPITA